MAERPYRLSPAGGSLKLKRKALLPINAFEIF